MELTKEYFDQKLVAQTEHFDQKIDEQTESLARMVQEGFAEVYRHLDVREQVQQHERDIEELKRALKLA
jgi:hypothetical protein